MSLVCNGCGDCDYCHNMRCEEKRVCDICEEIIDDDTYINYDDNDYHTDCFLMNYEVSQ